jgi:8-oxo-(d)GTP phosphatase
MSTHDLRTQIDAAGGVLWRMVEGQPRLAVVHRPRYDDWSLPKGKRDPEENFTSAALREVKEETGCSARLGFQAGIIRYRVSDYSKEVRFWHMYCEDNCIFEPSPEVDHLLWLSVEDALHKLDYPGERALLRARRVTS